MLGLKDHPFAVETFFESSVVITYALPAEDVTGFLPQCLEPDTFNDNRAFIAVALVKTKALRPKGMPEFIGNDFILIGYRVFVRYKDSRGKSLRGLYILKSQTNKKKMETWGNIFTHYNYTTTDIDFKQEKDIISISSKKSKLNIIVKKGEDIKLPEGSPFSDWREARRFAGPLPFTFTVDEQKNEVLIIEGVRTNWKPAPLDVIKAEVGFLKEKNLDNAVLANAFIVENIPYYWKKGRKDKWQG